MLHLPGKMIELNGYDLEPIKAELNQHDGHTVIFFLPDNQYGYGYTYKENYHTSNCLKDEFTEQEMLNDIDELIGAENRTSFIGEHSSNFEAVEEVVCFWTGNERGYYNPALSLEKAIQVGRWLNIDYIII